jgi:hypothetical protein
MPKVFDREMHERRSGAIQPQKNAENTEKNCFGEKRGFDREDLVLLFVLFAFSCG